MNNQVVAVKNYIARNYYYILLFLILLLIVVGFVLTFSLNNKLNSYTRNAAIYEKIQTEKSDIMANINNVDMSVRGYLLVENPAFLNTIKDRKVLQRKSYISLDTLFEEIGYDKRKFQGLRIEVDSYYALMEDALALHRAGNKEAAIAIIRKDKGTDTWLKWKEFGEEFDPFVKKLSEESKNSYDELLNFTIWYQIIMAIFGIPTLIFVIWRMKHNESRRKALFLNLYNQNNELIFNSNEKKTFANAAQVVELIISNLKKASNFIQNITQGNYDINWTGLTDENAHANQNNLAGELIKMREQMIKVRNEEDKRRWENEGLNELTSIIRKNQNDYDALTDEILSYLVKYVGARQGGLYVTFESEDGTKTLKLEGCYAYERKKHIHSEVEIGEGIIGQVYLERRVMHLDNIPNGYTTITSGLGQSTPTTLVVVPLNFNEDTEGVLEIASFKKYEPFEITFLQKAGEIIASSLINIQTNEKTKKLLELSQLQAEDMKNKEEEMRQNMEELEATQEEMQRKEQEMQRIIEGKDKSPATEE